MKTQIRIAVSTSVFFVSLSAFAQQKSPEPICDAKDARENFACSIEGSFTICRTHAELAALTGDWSTVRDCRKKFQPAVRKSYDAALARLKGKAAAQSEAKAAYAEWMAAADGLTPKSDETKMGYRSRTASLEDGLKKRVAAFKIDAGID